MPYTLSNLIRDALQNMGRSAYIMVKSTGTGSTTTFVDTTIDIDVLDADSAEDATLLITFDAAGASAAPENEFNRISSMTESSFTLTVDTAFTVAPAAGDEAMVISNEFPLIELKRIANATLKDLGYFPLKDVTLTSAANQTEYTCPTGIDPANITRIEYQGYTDDADDNQWVTVSNWSYRRLTPSGNTILILPQLTASRTIAISYMGPHPAVTAYSSVIDRAVSPRHASWAMAAALWAWKGPNDTQQKERANLALQKTAEYEVKDGVSKPQKAANWFVLGERNE